MLSQSGVPWLENVPAAHEADEHVDVLGSSTPVHGGADSERFTFRESVNHAYMQDSGGVLDTSGLPLFSFFNSHLHSALVFLGRFYILAFM